MTAVDDKLRSATARPLSLRMRRDLLVRVHKYGRRRYWTIKDPVSLNYFHLGEEEYAILDMLDGQTSIDQIQRRFDRRFAPRQLSGSRLQEFLARMHRCGLLLSDTTGQGDQLIERRTRKRYRRWLQAYGNVLAIRFRGVDPEPLLQWLYPRSRRLFSRWCIAGSILLICGAVLLVAAKFDDFQSKLPELQSFFSVSNALWIALALASVKILHELAHALTCRHFGGECHEMGLMLLVFTPCLYCNVSDSWMFDNKWQRIAVAAAGIYVELVLASIATLLWWFSQPGLLNMLCLNTLLICSAGTLFVNGNPLLRYDGYYVLSDLIEAPNLWTESRALVRNALVRCALGIAGENDPSLPDRHRRWLMLYAVVSTLYRWALVVAILWMLSVLLKPHGLQSVALAIGALVVISMVAGPLSRIRHWLRDPARKRQIVPARLVLTCAVLTGIGAVVCLVPLPRRIVVPVVLEYDNAERVYISVAGRLAKCVPAGKPITKGQLVAKLTNSDIRRQVASQADTCDRRRLQLDLLRARRAEDPAASAQIPVAEEALRGTQQRLEQLRQDERRLLLTAPKDGIVLPAPERPRRPRSDGQLTVWSGSLLDERNVGSFVETGTLLCLVGDPTQLSAILIVDQADIEFVRRGQRVRIVLAQLPDEVLHGSITEVSEIDLKAAPRQLVAHGDLSVRADEEGGLRPRETSYQARVSLDPHSHELLVGARGRAKILAAPEPLIRRARRLLARTLRFRFP